uniref:Uncharacterized protein n=1 Tax=Meloidogyne incognita TaxID=6306 RepID=A0A914N5I9_MELIC
MAGGVNSYSSEANYLSRYDNYKIYRHFLSRLHVSLDFQKNIICISVHGFHIF